MEHVLLHDNDQSAKDSDSSTIVPKALCANNLSDAPNDRLPMCNTTRSELFSINEWSIVVGLSNDLLMVTRMR